MSKTIVLSSHIYQNNLIVTYATSLEVCERLHAISSFLDFAWNTSWYKGPSTSLGLNGAWLTSAKIFSRRIYFRNFFHLVLICSLRRTCMAMGIMNCGFQVDGLGAVEALCHSKLIFWTESLKQHDASVECSQRTEVSPSLRSRKTASEFVSPDTAGEF
jgi:hypothetical protein